MDGVSNSRDCIYIYTDNEKMYEKSCCFLYKQGKSMCIPVFAAICGLYDNYLFKRLSDAYIYQYASRETFKILKYDIFHD